VPCNTTQSRKGNYRMRFRIMSALGAAALLVGVGASFAPAATASSASRPSSAAHGKVTQIHASPSGTDVVLYDQNSDDNGIGIVSQNFESGFDAYDASGADDFSIPANTVWKVKTVTVTGVYFNGPGPARDETVTFYRNKGGLPGAVVATRTAVGADAGGSYTIKLPTAVKLKGGLNGKSYWVGVVANMDFSVGGEWGWETRNTQNGKPSAWENPGDGFATGCTTWNTTNSCIGVGEGPDYMFALIGKIV
jgi:hypothetical protein